MRVAKIIGASIISVAAAVGGTLLYVKKHKENKEMEDLFLKYLQKFNSKLVEQYGLTYIQLRLKKTTKEEAEKALTKLSIENSKKVQENLKITDQQLLALAKHKNHFITELLKLNEESFKNCLDSKFPCILTALVDEPTFVKLFQRYALAKLDLIQTLVVQKRSSSTYSDDDELHEKLYNCYKGYIKLSKTYSLELAMSILQYYYGIKTKKAALIKALNDLVTKGALQIREGKADAKLVTPDPFKITDEEVEKKLEEWKKLLGM